MVDRERLLSSPREIRELPDDLARAVIHAIAEGVTSAFTVAVPVVLVAFGFAWLLREVPLRATGNLTSPEEAVRSEPLGAAGLD